MLFRSGLIAAAVAAGLGSPALAQGDAAAGEQIFARSCRACHQAGPEARNGAGPALIAVVGHPIASAEGFRYSPAFTAKKDEGFVWNEEELSEYLANPRAYIPGNRMAFPGVRDETDLANLVAYLATLQ
jgi:cytochrome c